MPRALFAALALLALPFAAHAQIPNLEPGLWENRHTTIIEGEGVTEMPEQTETTSHCVTQEDLERGPEFVEAPPGCEIEQIDMSEDGMDYTMTCMGPQGEPIEMVGSVRFMGDRAEGEMTSEIETPSGTVKVRMETRAEHVGDC